MIRKFTALALSVLLLLPVLCVHVSAEEELPHSFWALNDAYLAAKEAGDDDGIISFGEQVTALLTAVPETNQIKEILASRYYDVADAYDRKNAFITAAAYYQKYIPYGEYMNWEDGVRIARSKAQHYTPSITAYTSAVQPQKFYGAVNEPELGVLYGQVAEQSQQDESMILLYIDYGNQLSGWDRSILEQAKQRGAAVEIAWNIQGEGSALAEIPNQTAYISGFLQELNQYKDIPMYLRIGAEMNVWPDPADPEQFKTAFRLIADMVHEQTSHVAAVWSVAHASDWNSDMEDFYPGDEYVDWVGISAYLIRHFQGREWPLEQRFNEVSFGAGDGADPVLVVKEVLDKFGGRKPIMLAECGSAHTTVSLGQDNTDWAVANLQRMYWFVPMVYPQVKLIAYFNTYIAPEANDYALTHSPALNQAYQAAAQAPHFIQKNYGGEAEQTYRPLEDGMVLTQTQTHLYAYPKEIGDSKPAVRYYVDGNPAGESAEIPYQAVLDLTRYGLGEHVVRAEAVSGGQTAAAAEYRIQITENILVTLDGGRLKSDVAPIMEQDRVLVPMRTIFEALGASVTWDEASQTAAADRAGTHIEITIDNQILKKNGSEIPLDVPARMVSGRTMVPVRAVSEALGAAVDWNGSENTVVIKGAD